MMDVPAGLVACEEKNMREIINLNKDVDFLSQPLFFGEGLNIQRYDKFKYKKYFTLFLNQLGFSWRPEEVTLGGKERVDFQSLTDNEKFIFTSNLKYQTLLDSVQARGIPYLRHYLSNTELEAAMGAWEFFEFVHSYSYTYIIKNVYSNPTEVFDSILEDEEIIKRATSVTKYYNDLIGLLDDSDEREKKIKLYLTLVSINILEGIRFYVSFACSFCFAENKKMEGNAKIISLIARDENIHLSITQNILREFKNNPDEGFQDIVEEYEPLVYEMYQTAAEEEKEWARYLFKDGSMLGLNDTILIKYMEWLTNKRLRSIGLKHIFEGATNPIEWIGDWLNSKRVQVAPQETEISSYVVGSFKQDLDDYDFSEFEF